MELVIGCLIAGIIGSFLGRRDEAKRWRKAADSVAHPIKSAGGLYIVRRTD